MTEQNLQINKTDMIVEEVLKRLMEKMHAMGQKTTQKTQNTQTTKLSDFHRNIFVKFDNGEEKSYSSQFALYKEITKEQKTVFKMYKKIDASIYIKITKYIFNLFCEKYNHPKILKLKMILKDGTELTV